jgi:ABC-type oligopeptide transport system substrate-binding subunit
MLEAPSDFFYLGWSTDYPDPDDFLRIAISSYTPKGWNEKYEKLIDKARRETDQPQRISFYHEAERILAHEAPIIPIMYARIHLFLKPWVRQFRTSIFKPFNWTDVVIEPH